MTATATVSGRPVTGRPDTGRPDTVWVTRCPVPTAAGIALRLGFLDEALGPFGVRARRLEDGPPGSAARHLDHDLPGLFREGGSVPALAARAAGAPTRLVGLTWFDERQVVLARPDAGIASAVDLAGRRLALPEVGDRPGGDVMRAMALQGFRGALATAGLGLTDVEPVAVPEAPPADAAGTRSAWTAIDAVAAGHADAAYAKGSAALADARAAGLEIAVDLDAEPDRRTRVNNGTPRPVTVHEDTLRERPGLVAAYLAAGLRAADWAAAHPSGARRLFLRHAGGDARSVAEAYGAGAHRRLHPDLSEERLGLLGQQASFLHAHGFLAAPVDVAAWADPAPLAAAHALVAADR